MTFRTLSENDLVALEQWVDLVYTYPPSYRKSMIEMVGVLVTEYRVLITEYRVLKGRMRNEGTSQKAEQEEGEGTSIPSNIPSECSAL